MISAKKYRNLLLRSMQICFKQLTLDFQKLEGVVAFYDKNDVPGRNVFMPKGETDVNIDEELFCSGTVLYNSQPIGIIVAKTQEIAERAVELVEVTYTEGKGAPVYTVREVLKANAKDRIMHISTTNPKRKGM